MALDSNPENGLLSRCIAVWRDPVLTLNAMKIIFCWMIVLSTAPFLLANAKKTTAPTRYTTSTTASTKPKRPHNSGSPTPAATNPVKQQQRDLAKLESSGSPSRESTTHPGHARTTAKANQPREKATEFNYRSDKGAVKAEKNVPRARIDRVQKKP
jgi:hypothetical protein